MIHNCQFYHAFLLDPGQIDYSEIPHNPLPLPAREINFFLGFSLNYQTLQSPIIFIHFVGYSSDISNHFWQNIHTL